MNQTVNTVCGVAMFGLAIGTTGCTSLPTSDVHATAPQIEAELMAVDRAYEGFLTGQAAIMAERQLDMVPSPVHWQPEGAMGAASGDLGITWGSFVVDGDPDTTGDYVTVWRKVNGEWKIVTDTAVDDPDPAD